MRLINLTVRNFRGFGTSSVPIPLDADLVLLYGPNGYGKTSLAEAIEWLLYGTTRRRQRGDSYSKNEFEGCFPNVHGGAPVEVIATVRPSSGTPHSIARRIPNPRNDTVSITYVDGAPADFSTIGIAGIGAVHPVIAQHDLQSFIHSRPKERRDAISAALGLDELTFLKTALDGARRSFNSVPPTGVEEARAKLRPLAAVLTTITETKTVGQRWLKSPPEVKADDDQKALIAAAKKITASTEDNPENLLIALREKRRQLSRTVFDTASLLPPSDVTATVTRLSTEATNLEGACKRLADQLAKAVARAASKYATTLLQFWDAGLKIAPDGTTCPMCEENTLSASKRTDLQERLKAAQEALANSREVTVTTTAATSALAVARQASNYAVVTGVDTEKRALLTALIAKSPEALAAFLEVHDLMLKAVEEVTNAHIDLGAYLKSVPELLSDPTKAETLIAGSTELPARFVTAAGTLGKTLARYEGAWKTFEQVLAKEIASNTDISAIDAVGQALKAEPERKKLAIYDDLLNKSRALMQAVEAHLQRKQTTLLASRGKEMKEIYDRLNPGAQVGFETMEPGNEQLKLHAKSFGVRMSAAANLSECQLNCLGISFWLGRALAPGSPFGFILLDDPVQSMDDDHCEAFISTVVPSLCDDRKKQVILLSHERKLIDRVRDLNKARDTSIYHYDEYEMTGPSITQQVNLAVMLREVQSLAKGNEANRSSAVDKLRKVGEEYIRELHLKVVGTPAPPAYDNATPSELLELFQKIPGTTPTEHAGLKDTFGFASPAHHQQAGYSVPVTTNITPHTQRLEQLMKKYKLIR